MKILKSGEFVLIFVETPDERVAMHNLLFGQARSKGPACLSSSSDPQAESVICPRLQGRRTRKGPLGRLRPPPHAHLWAHLHHPRLLPLLSSPQTHQVLELCFRYFRRKLKCDSPTFNSLCSEIANKLAERNYQLETLSTQVCKTIARSARQPAQPPGKQATR